MKPELPAVQRAVLEYIESVLAKTASSPSIREIAAEFRLKSTSTAFNHLLALRRKKYIDWTEGQKRTIVVRRARLGAPVPVGGGLFFQIVGARDTDHE